MLFLYASVVVSLSESSYFCVIRHGRCFWFSGQSRGDHCKAGVSEGGVASMHGFGAVWRQDAAILPDTSCDGQTGLIPHGFRKRQLRGGQERRAYKFKQMNSSRKHGHGTENAIICRKASTFLYIHMHKNT